MSPTVQQQKSSSKSMQPFSPQSATAKVAAAAAAGRGNEGSGVNSDSDRAHHDDDELSSLRALSSSSAMSS